MGQSYQQTTVATPAPAPKNHNLAYGAGGAAAGLVAGALLMHEGEKVGALIIDNSIYLHLCISGVMAD